MLRFAAAAVLLGAAAGCSPTFNWREVRVEPTRLKAMLPCKPEKAARRLPVAGREVEFSVIGCEAGGATFAVLHARVLDPAMAAETLVQWNRATVAQLGAAAPSARPFLPPGATPSPAAVRVAAAGKRQDGSPLQSEAAYFTHDGQVFQAVVYAPSLQPEGTQPFFEGLKFE